MSSKSIRECTGILYLFSISIDARSFNPISIRSKHTRTLLGFALFFSNNSIESIIDLPEEITSSTISASPFGWKPRNIPVSPWSFASFLLEE